MRLKKFFIPQQHYVGLAVQKDRTLPWALITPYSTDPQSVKRVATINSWLSRKADKVAEPTVMDNLPLSGFVLTQLIRRGEYGSPDKWVIQDPRGFELEISSDNVAEIFANSLVDKGHVNNSLIWTRKGKVNWLVVDGSDQHRMALEQSVSEDVNVTWADVKLGSIVKLTDGTQGQYLGKMWCIAETVPNIQSAQQERFALVPTPNYVIHVNSSSITWTSKYTEELHCSPVLELDSVIVHNTLSIQECEQKANQLLNDPSCYLRCARGKTPRLMSHSPIPKNSWSFELTELDLQTQSYQDILSSYQTVIVQTYDHNWGSMVKKFNLDKCSFFPINKNLLDQGQFCYETKRTTKGNFEGSYVKKESEKDLTQIKRMYLIDIKVTTPDSHTIRVKV